MQARDESRLKPSGLTNASELKSDHFDPQPHTVGSDLDP
jgi:hypothetical protein